MIFGRRRGEIHSAQDPQSDSLIILLSTFSRWRSSVASRSQSQYGVPRTPPSDKWHSIRLMIEGCKLISKAFGNVGLSPEESRRLSGRQFRAVRWASSRPAGYVRVCWISSDWHPSHERSVGLGEDSSANVVKQSYTAREAREINAGDPQVDTRQASSAAQTECQNAGPCQYGRWLGLLVRSCPRGVYSMPGARTSDGTCRK
jgi:hypothetical protein